MERNTLRPQLAGSGPTSLGPRSTYCSRSVLHKADGLRIQLRGDRGYQRENREQPGLL